MAAQSAFHLPTGIKNLAPIFPSVSWKDVEEYYLEVSNLEGIVVATTCRNLVDSCSNDDERVRIHFLNALGGIDAVNFCTAEETYETQSSAWEKPLSYPLVKSDGGSQRYNVKGNDSYKVTTTCYTEQEMIWLKELLRTPAAWIEWKGNQGQPDDYLPVVITDAKPVTRKVVDRYLYEFIVEFKMANADITIRN